MYLLLLGEKLRGGYPHWYLLVRHLWDQSRLKLHVLPPLTSTRAFILRQRLWGQAGLEPHELLPPTCTRALPHLPLWDQTKEGNASCMHGFSLHTSPASPQLTSTRTFSHPLLWGHTQKLGYASCMHGISPHPSQVHVSFLPTVLQPCRMLLAAVDHERHCQGELANQTEVEAGLTFSNKSLTEISKALSDIGLESTAKLPAEVALRNYFKRAKAIAHVVDLLKKRVWDDELQEALRSSSVTFDTLLITQVLRVDLPCDVAVSFFQWLKHQCRFEHNEYTYGVMLNTLGRVGRLDEMQQLFDEMKSKGCTVTPVTLSNVMLCFFKAKDMRGVAHHWNTLRRLGTKPSAAIYTAYIDFLVRSKRFTKIAVIFEEMLRVDCLPSSRTYTVFIQHLVEAGNVEAAAKILKAIQTMRVVPSRVTYKIVINGFAKVGNVEMVLELLKEMREHFHRPTKQLMPAVRALQAADRLEEAVTLLGEIWPESVPGISDTVQLSDEDDTDAADDSECGMTVWRSVTCSHVGFDVNAFSQALHAWNPKVEEALEQASIQWESSLVLEILRRLRNLESLWPFFHWLKDRAGFKHDSYTCALLIQRILKSRSTLEKKAFLMKELFEGLRKDGMKFTVPMFNLVIRHYVAVGEAEKALDMFNLIKQFVLEPNETSYALIIQGFAKNRHGKKAMELLKEMEEEGFPLDNITCAELITCLGLAGKTERAYALFRSMSASGRSPGPLEYKAIMATYARVGDNGMALKLYEEMRKDGIAPTQDMYEVVVRILQEANRLSDVQVLAEERGLLNFFDGNKKVLQERLLQVLFLFMESMKPRKAQEAYPIATS